MTVLAYSKKSREERLEELEMAKRIISAIVEATKKPRAKIAAIIAKKIPTRFFQAAADLHD